MKNRTNIPIFKAKTEVMNSAMLSLGYCALVEMAKRLVRMSLTSAKK